jgi:seryl-tRNA(Sec) selenium transferase
MPPDSCSPASPNTDLEERLRAEEAHLYHEARVLEQQIQRLQMQKAAAKAARDRAEQLRAQEAEHQNWQQALQVEVERATDRLNAQRRSQLAECAAFEQRLSHDMQALQAACPCTCLVVLTPGYFPGL